MLRSEVATSSVEKPLFMGDFGNFNYQISKEPVFFLPYRQPSVKDPTNQGRVALQLLKNNDWRWKTFHTNFPLCCFYASSFLDQGSLTFSFLFLILLRSHPSICLCFHFSLWQLCCWDGGERERPVVRVMLRAAPSCQGCSHRGTQDVPTAEPRLSSKRGQSRKGSIRMQGLGLLGSGTAFGITVCKKDGLHLSQAWLAVVILVTLYFSEAWICFLFNNWKTHCALKTSEI